MNACRDAGMIPGDKLTNIAYQKIKDVHTNLEAIRKVADRLTPVADLEEFRSMIEAVYADLEALANAADLMLAATPAGIAMLTAADVTAQRLLLQLGSAALLDGDTLALKTDVDTLSASLAAVADDLAALVLVVGQKAAQSDVEAAQQAIADLVLQVAALEDLVGTPGSGGTGTIGDILIDIEGRLQQVITTVQSHSGTLITVNNSVQELDGRITQVNELNTLLTNRVNTIDGALDVQAGVNNLLGQRITVTEDGVAAVQQDVTSMGLTVDDLSNGVAATLLAVDELTQRVTTAEDKVELFSSRTTTLEQNYEDLNEGQTALAQAMDALTLTTTDLDDRLTIEASRVTTLRTALRTSANLVSNSGFETGTFSWSVSNRGSGWLTAQLQRNIQSDTLRPPGTNTLGLTVPGLPTGNVSFQSAAIAVEPGKFYYLSGYLAAANATARLEYRWLDATNAQISAGVIGESAPGGMVLSAWTRRSVKVTAPAGARLLILIVWITNATDIGPYAILLRPMVEEVWADQEGPSPWVEGASGFGDALAEANAGLIARVDALEEGVDALAQDFSDLSAQVGDLSADAFNALTARVTATENENTSQANDITNLQSSLGDVEGETAANATAISALTARVSAAEGGLSSISSDITELESSVDNIGSDNLLPNSSLEDQVTSNRPRYWTRAFVNSAPATVDSFVPSNLGGSTNAWRLEGTGYNGTTHFIDISQFVGDGLERPKARPSDRFVFTAYVRGSANANVQLVFQYLNSSASTIVTYNIPYVLMTSDYVRLKYVAPAAPAGTTQVRVYVRILPTDSSAFWVEVDNLQLQEGITPTAYMPSATLTGEANAAATSALAARVTSAENLLVSQSNLTTALQSSLNVLRKQVTILDTSFEEDNVWTMATNFSIVSNVANARSGRRYLLITGGTAAQNISQNGRFEVQVGKTLRAGYWARQGASAPNGYIRLTVRWYDGDGVQIPSGFVYIPGTQATTTEIGNTYVKMSGSIVVPEGAVSAAVGVQTGHTTGQWFLDDIFAEIVSEAELVASTAISNLETRTTATENALTTQAEFNTRLESSLGQIRAQGMTASATGLLSDWSAFSGSGELSIISSSDASVMGGRLLQMGNNSGNDEVWVISREMIPIDPSKLYRVRVRMRMSDGSGGVYYGGLACRNADKTQFVNASNALSGGLGASLYVAVGLSNTTYVESVGYFKGMSAGARTGAGTLADPWTFPNQAAYMHAMAIGNYTGQTGITYLDRIVIEDADAVGDSYANAQAISTLTTDVTNVGNAQTATANAVTALRAELGGGVNMLRNAGFEVDLGGWYQDNGNIGAALSIVRSDGFAVGSGDVTTYYIPRGTTAIQLRVPGTTVPNGNYGQTYSENMPVQVGKQYLASCYINNFRCQAVLIIVWYNSAGTYLSENQIAQNPISLANPTMVQMARINVKATAPANAVYARVVLRMWGNGGNDPYIWFCRPMLEEVPVDKTSPSTWDAGSNGLDNKYAGITQTLSTRATTLENGQTTLLARYALRLDVNGYSIGWEANNNGSQGAIKFRADLFEISSPSGGERLEYSNGNIRTYYANGNLAVRLGKW